MSVQSVYKRVVKFMPSKKTKKSDLVNKKKLYAWLGVKEYFLFDPFGEYLKPRLTGFQLQGGEYTSILPQGHEPRLHSEYLSLDLVPEGGRLRFWNARVRAFLPTYEEVDEQRKLEAEARRLEAKTLEHEVKARERETEARRAAEAEVARLRKELAQSRQE